ncbi:MAG: hypothetical protein JWP25_6728 [Bradyrhizobium sp.]|nr:hypothetical protein [Bradyrhizobium sp.]
MQKIVRWLSTLLSAPALLALLFSENIKRLFDQEGWNKWLAYSWHPVLNMVIAVISTSTAAYVICFVAGVAATMWFVYLRNGKETGLIEAPLAQALYVGEMRVQVEHIAQERHSEISIRVFNGTGKAISLVGVSGQIAFSGSGGTGKLPTPTIRPDSAASVKPCEEWFILMNQRIPSDEATKLVSTLDKADTIQFDMREIKIEVSDGDRKASLNLWGGVSASRATVSYGRVVHLTANIRLG